MLSLPSCDLLSAHLGAPEYLQAGIWLKRGSSDRRMCDEWRPVFVRPLLFNEAQYFCIELQHPGGKAVAAMEGVWVVFNDGWAGEVVCTVYSAR